LKDLELDFINKKIINKLIDGKERVNQQIRLAVNTFIGDWLLDEEFGVDYFNSWSSKQLMEFFIRQQIKQVSGVDAIKSFFIEMIANDNKQYFKIDTEIKYEGDILKINEIIGV